MKVALPDFENTEIAFAHQSTTNLKKAKLLFSLIGYQPLVDFGASFTGFSLAIGLPVSPLYKYSVFNHFCGGEDFEECKTVIQDLAKFGVGAMLNYGVELKETEADFDKTIAHTIEAILFAAKNKAVKCLCIKITGFGRFDLFEKISSGIELSLAENQELAKAKSRLNQLCSLAAQHQVALYIDAEESWIQAALDALIDEMMAKFNTDFPVVYNTYQLYRTDRLDFLKKSHDLAKQKGYLLGAKIVRGAYMEKERERAKKMNYPSPIHADKEAVDIDFNQAMNYCLSNLDTIALCIASQSEESNLLAIDFMQKNDIPFNHKQLYFSQLYGMGDNITFNLAKAGCNACKYLPYGPVKDVIPYLIRRAQENTAVSGQMSRELKLINTELERRKCCS